MTEHNFFEQSNIPVVVALGFFDCLHLGHRKIIESAGMLAQATNSVPALFTFCNNPFKTLNKDTKLVYTYFERLSLLKDTCVKKVVFAEFNSQFCKMTALDFLTAFTKNYKIAGLVCGMDHKIGSDKKGIDFLSEYCKQNNIQSMFVPDITKSGSKVSSTRVRALLTEGKVSEAASILGADYFCSGKVEYGQKIGGKLGFPTANLALDADKLCIKEGVYATKTVVNGQVFRSITNFGSAPTFDKEKINIETYISGFDRDIYGQNISVYFLDRIRDIMRFSSGAQLEKQLKKDKEVLSDDKIWAERQF